LGLPTNIASNSLTISWNKPPIGGGVKLIVEYIVEVMSHSEKTEKFIVPGSNQNIKTKITGMTSNTLYTITVAASEGGDIIGKRSNKETAITCEYCF